MRNIRIEKVTLNIGCGESGEKLDKAKKLLEVLTGKKKIVVTTTHDRTTFGDGEGKAHRMQDNAQARRRPRRFLKRALAAVDFKLSKSVFDRQGSFSFGVKEHIDIPGMKYDPEIGIFGMDVCVTLERPGFSIKRKKFPAQDRQEAFDNARGEQDWVAKNYKVEIDMKQHKEGEENTASGLEGVQEMRQAQRRHKEVRADVLQAVLPRGREEIRIQKIPVML